MNWVTEVSFTPQFQMLTREVEITWIYTSQTSVSEASSLWGREQRKATLRPTFRVCYD